MIKNIEDLKKIQIVCREIDQVEDCYNHLEQLGFKVSYYGGEGFFFIIRYNDELSGFSNYGTMAGDKYIDFYNKKFIKTLQKFIKEKREKKEEVKDFEASEDGRITKINNWKSEKIIYCFKADCPVNKANQDNVEEAIKYGLVYATEQARDKAMFKLEIETKLKNIAEKLNKKIHHISSNLFEINVPKYSLSIEYTRNLKKKLHCYSCGNNSIQKQGTIYCLDENFLEVAKQEIGEENLIKYFEE